MIPLDGLRVSRSLRRSTARYEVRVDTDFATVIERCATIPRPHGWITPAIVDAYVRLHELGIAHSVEAWDDGRLAGGLYGISLGGFFAGESMFHDATDASKVALVGLVGMMRPVPGALLDVQWSTPHLQSLGSVELEVDAYLDRLRVAVAAPTPSAFVAGRSN